jgi:hypothetical protein
MPFPSDAPQKSRDRLDAGTLPTELPPKMYAGYGQGEPCCVCDEPIHKAQVEYEMDYGGDRIFRLHLGCAGLWEAECRRRGHRRSS